MEVRLLGPLEVVDGDRTVPVARGRESTLLTLLALHAGAPLTTERIVEELWEGRPPEQAAKNVQVHVSRLRRALGADRIETTAAGYLLRLEDGELDSGRFESLAAAGRAALERGDAAAARISLEAALALWRGDALADFRYAAFAQDAARRLDEQRAASEADLLDAELALGQVDAVIPRLRELVAADPGWERPRGQLMLALYRAGRQAEALEQYSQARAYLLDELGVEPGTELQALQRAILTQDPSLDRPRRQRPPARRRGPAVLVAVGGALLLVAAAVVALLATRSGDDRPAIAALAPNTLGSIDPGSNRLVAQIPAGSGPAGVVVRGDEVWIADAGSQQLVVVDARDSKVLRRVPLASIPTALATGRAALWATQPLETAAGTLARVDPASGRATTILVRTGYVGDLFARAAPYALAVDGQTVWTNTQHGRLVRLVGGRRTAYDLGRGHSIDAIAVGGGSVWIASSADDTVLRVDPRTGRLLAAPIELRRATGVRAGPAAIAYGAGGVWVAAALANRVVRIDPRSDRVVASIPVQGRPTGIAVGAGGVWALAGAGGSVARIDPAHDRVTASIPVGRPATAIAAGADRVWVTVAGGRAAGAGRPPLPARPLVTGSCGPLQSGGTAPDLIVVSDLPSYQNGDGDNPNIRDMRRAILATLQQRGFRAGPYRVGLQQCTDSSPGSSPDLPLCAANARAYAANPSVVGVVGTYQSSCAMVELPILNAAPTGPVAVISPSNTYVGLTHEGPQTAPDEPDRYYPIGVRNYVRVVPPDDVQGAALAALARRLGHSRLFVLDDGDPTAKAMATYISRAARRVGLAVVGGAHWGKPPSFPALAAQIRDARADAVVITGCICSDGGRLMVVLRRGLGDGVPLLASDNFTFGGDMGSPDAPPEVFGTYISEAGADPATLGARGRTFLRTVLPGRPLTDIDRLVPAAAAATSALLDAIARSDGSRASIVEELTHGRAAATPLGSLSFDANGDATRYPVSIYRISRDAPPGPHLPVQGLKLDRLIEADPAMSAP